MLITSSCLLGMAVGLTVTTTLKLQQAAFLGYPMVFGFPWKHFLLALGVCCMQGYLSAWRGATKITDQTIADTQKQR